MTGSILPGICKAERYSRIGRPSVCVTWLIHMCAMIYFGCAPWLMHTGLQMNESWRTYNIAWLEIFHDSEYAGENMRIRVCVHLCMGWLRLVGSLRVKVFFAKEPYKRDDILQKRRIIWRSLLIVATPYEIPWLEICNIEYSKACHQITYFKSCMNHD